MQTSPSSCRANSGRASVQRDEDLAVRPGERLVVDLPVEEADDAAVDEGLRREVAGEREQVVNERQAGVAVRVRAVRPPPADPGVVTLGPVRRGIPHMVARSGSVTSFGSDPVSEAPRGRGPRASPGHGLDRHLAALDDEQADGVLGRDPLTPPTTASRPAHSTARRPPRC